MFVFSPMSHEAAAARIASLPLVSRDVMDNLLPELRAYAFTVSGLDVGDTMARVRDTLKAVPLGAKNWDKARKEIAAELDDALGGKVAQRRAELLLRTHVFRGYAAARYRNLIAQVDVLPFWQYKTHGDGNVRPSHAALNGKIFPAGHPIWQTIFPPWDWGCRCLVTALTKRAAGLVMDRGRISDKAAKDANLLPTQIATPEMFSDYEAGLIAKNGRLPNGVPLNRTPTWADSPWSETGSVHHDWQLIRKRYADQPEVLAAFEQLADKTEIMPGVTIATWLDKGPAALVKKAAKLTLKKSLVKKASTAAKAVATRSTAELLKGMTALDAEHKAAEAALSKAQIACGSTPYGTPAFTAAKLAEQQARLELDTIRERAREACSIPAAERGTLPYLPAPTMPQNFDAGRAITERFVHADYLPNIKAHIIGSTARASAGFDGTINVTLNESAGVIAHEIVHNIEYNHPAVLHASSDFIRSRVGPKDRFKKLKTLYPRHRYKDYEISFEDEWGKRGGSAYSGKIYCRGVRSPMARRLWIAAAKTDPDTAYRQLYCTEVLTVGIERLEADPLAFLRDDPDYFKFTVATLQKLTP